MRSLLHTVAMLWLLIWRLQAASVAVIPGEITPLDLDLDGDGRAEIIYLYGSETSGSFAFNLDWLNSYTTILGRPFNRMLNAVFPDLDSLYSSEFFSLTLLIPNYTGRDSDIGGGHSTFGVGNPINAAWMLGTAGTGSDPVSVVGIVVDATNYYATSGTAPIDLYTHNFGQFGPGESPFLSLAATGVPEPNVIVMLGLVAIPFILKRRPANNTS